MARLTASCLRDAELKLVKRVNTVLIRVKHVRNRNDSQLLLLLATEFKRQALADRIEFEPETGRIEILILILVGEKLSRYQSMTSFYYNLRCAICVTSDQSCLHWENLIEFSTMKIKGLVQVSNFFF